MAEKRKKEETLLRCSKQKVVAYPHPFSKHYFVLPKAASLKERAPDVVVRAYPYCSSVTHAAAVSFVRKPDCVIAEPFIDKYSDEIILRFVWSATEYEFKSCKDAKHFMQYIGKKVLARHLRDQILDANGCLLHLDYFVRLASCIAVDAPHDGLTFDPRYMEFVAFMKASVRFSHVRRDSYFKVAPDFYIPLSTVIEVNGKVVRAFDFLKRKFETLDDSKFSLDYFAFRLVP